MSKVLKEFKLSTWSINNKMTVFVEGLNLTGENSRSHARNESMLWYLTDLDARYQVGMRYEF